ncbi:ABC transporter B family member 26, chloroplastic [Dichanthelium oligosanthes]|uniref:ABC transporter B family member 26, chloroplastic n=1 Tax=Dichanthelium oligosanthes TaxID=888268 RepID=A0A1E5VVA0_9POAL|nr:ABC transporter B family member 26, chloroplastic [Dichanthelium oligosanthes]
MPPPPATMLLLSAASGSPSLSLALAPRRAPPRAPRQRRLALRPVRIRAAAAIGGEFGGLGRRRVVVGEFIERLRNVLPGGSWWRLEDGDEAGDGGGRAEGSGTTALSALRRMWGLVAADRWVIYAGFASLVGAALAEIAIPHLLAASIFSAQNGGAVFYQNAKLLVVLCLISGVFRLVIFCSDCAHSDHVVSLICSGVRSCCFGVANMILVKRMREMLFDSILSQDISFFDEETVGDLTSRLGSDCQQVSRVIGNDLNLISRNLLQVRILFRVLLLNIDQSFHHRRTQVREVGRENSVRRCIIFISIKTYGMPALWVFLMFFMFMSVVHEMVLLTLTFNIGENFEGKGRMNFKVPILGRLNLTLNPNEVVAIVGLSGSGKSTIINLLLRLYEPTNGQILVDGVPLTELDIRWFRERIGFVGQEPRLFRMDISSNIKYGCPRDVSHEEVVWAAKQAYAHDFIMSLPDGYNTIVDDALLSGGQKQRVAIARALLRDPSILLLDEATSALDAESEHYVKSVITKVSHDSRTKRTVVIIAHRLSTIQTADRIIVMENGEIVEDGKHSELLEKNGLYSRLARRQNDDLE